MKEFKIGYTQGTYDMFHIGHLNLLRQAKSKCDYLIVGINSDHLVQEYKGKTPVINHNDRAAIIRELKVVDEVIICDTLDKMAIFKKKKFDAIFIGDDWKGNNRWQQTERDMEKVGVSIVYLKHTDGISSTMLRTKESHKVNE